MYNWFIYSAQKTKMWIKLKTQKVKLVTSDPTPQPTTKPKSGHQILQMNENNTAQQHRASSGLRNFKIHDFRFGTWTKHPQPTNHTECLSYSYEYVATTPRLE